VALQTDEVLRGSDVSSFEGVALAELIGCWLLWSLAFVKPRKQAAGQQAVVAAPVARWGIVLQMLGFALVWAYLRPAGFQKAAVSLIISMILGPASVVLAWMAARHLGKQWRFEAALIQDHDLVQTGPYQVIRHPIYASMLGMLLATGFAWTWWPMFAAGLIAYLAGTEIRVRTEDRLLEERFQEAFVAYRSRVRAYIPGLR
jgi:protein-S-isoprenylcysteine O-methyltransferase Ste14